MLITDQYIIDRFFTDKGNRIKYYNKEIQNNSIIKKYLDNRFNDCTDYNEILWRIKLCYEQVPICPICNKNKLKFKGTIQIGYNQTCSKICRNKLWHINMTKTIQEKYNVDNCFQSEICKQKIRETNLERYGVTCSLQNKEIQNKSKYTNLKRYGVENGGGSIQSIQKNKETCLRKYGVTNIMYMDGMVDKIYEIRKQNHTINTSKPEEMIYQKLCEKYDNVKRQYKSELYPYRCDFYISEKDLYIECNFHWTHGNHLFDENNEDDIQKLNTWKSKNTHYYKCAIKTWTIMDPLKIKTANDNKLNYQIFYDYKECLQYIKNDL